MLKLLYGLFAIEAVEEVLLSEFHCHVRVNIAVDRKMHI